MARHGFPVGTLAVNLVGSFLIGLVQHLAAAQILSEDARLLLSTGVMGTILCLALCVAGMALGRLLTR
jgi:fluoride ion exporter CrcB/FEX